ncbi:MAG: hypothetical protein E4G95_00940 [Bacteroidia bacterium]|nr:MAG: hypothetical protein E4G95_00940 [Bacteroidia bacterium]
MKKIKINTSKTFIIFMSIVAIIGLLWSCEDEKMEVFWNDNEAADISEVTPQGAFVGSEVTIHGKYFSSKALNTVSFGGMDATIIGANITEITVEIPGVTPGAAVDVVVTSDGKTSNALSYTTGVPIIPVLTALNPTSGKVGSSVVITGTNFGATTEDNIVKFNGTEATVTDVTATTVTATVPAGAPTGEVDITVTVDGESNALTYTVLEAYTLVVPVTVSEDDVEEGGLNGAMTLTSSDLEIGEWDTWDAISGTDQGVQVIGIRFPNITIPPGATVLSASIQLTSDASGSEVRQVTIYGEAIGNAPVYTNDLYNVSTRVRTTANYVWDIPAWTNEGLSGAAQRTGELNGVVQEVLDRVDWASGNALNFIMLYTGPAIPEGADTGGRQTKSFDDGANDVAPVLTIVYDL